ncbi:MAG: hypothetical protein DLM70_10995 [Chloroflexi bacterium]|nr:MAG: hypothetical protein DLM70_10995 [Chloroflexota bacterium]
MPTPKPKKPGFKYVSLWYKFVHLGTYNHVEVQAKPAIKDGIWVHVIFPSGRHWDWYESTDSHGHWAKFFRVYRNTYSGNSNVAYVTVQLWHGAKTAKTFRKFYLV